MECGKIHIPYGFLYKVFIEKKASYQYNYPLSLGEIIMMAGSFSITKNPFNRFDIDDINDEYTKDDKIIKGINGFHGRFSNFIGRILEIFHITVAVAGKDGNYYLNCKSFIKWLKRLELKEGLPKDLDIKNIESDVHNQTWVHNALNDIIYVQRVEKKLQEEKNDKVAQEVPNPQNPPEIEQKEFKTFQEYFNEPNRAGQEAFILEKLKNGKTYNQLELDLKGNTLLHLATEKGYLTVVDYAVETLKINVNAVNRDQLTPLHLAAKHNQRDVALYLIKHGAENNKNKNDTSPSDMATDYEHSDLAREIKEKAPRRRNEFIDQVKQKEDKIEKKEKQNLEDEKKEKQNNVQQKEGKQNNPKPLDEMFSKLSQPEILEKVKKGEISTADVDEKGNSILHFAVRYAFCDIIEHAVETKKMDVNGVNHEGSTPLHWAAELPNHIRTAKFLIKLGADVTKKNKNGKLPEDLANDKGIFELVKLLNEKRKSIEEKKEEDEILQEQKKANDIDNPQQKTLKDYFIRGVNKFYKEKEIIEKLKNNELNPNERDEKGNSILHLAVRYEYEQVLHYFVETFKMDINAVNDEDLTPLHIAAIKTLYPIAGYLVEHGALNKKNKYNESPEDLARQNGKGFLAKALNNGQFQK